MLYKDLIGLVIITDKLLQAGFKEQNSFSKADVVPRQVITKVKSKKAWQQLSLLKSWTKMPLFGSDRPERYDVIGFDPVKTSISKSSADITQASRSSSPSSAVVTPMRIDARKLSAIALLQKANIEQAYLIHVNSGSDIQFDFAGATPVKPENQMLKGLPNDCRYLTLPYGDYTTNFVEFPFKKNDIVTFDLVYRLMDWAEAFSKSGFGKGVFIDDTDDARILALALSLYMNRKDTGLFSAARESNAYDLNQHFAEVFAEEYQNQGREFSSEVKAAAVRLCKLMFATKMVYSIQEKVKKFFEGFESKNPAQTLSKEDQYYMSLLMKSTFDALQAALNFTRVDNLDSLENCSMLIRAVQLLNEQEQKFSYLLSYKNRDHKPSPITIAVNSMYRIIEEFVGEGLFPALRAVVPVEGEDLVLVEQTQATTISFQRKPLPGTASVPNVTTANKGASVPTSLSAPSVVVGQSDSDNTHSSVVLPKLSLVKSPYRVPRTLDTGTPTPTRSVAVQSTASKQGQGKVVDIAPAATRDIKQITPVRPVAPFSRVQNATDESDDEVTHTHTPLSSSRQVTQSTESPLIPSTASVLKQLTLPPSSDVQTENSQILVSPTPLPALPSLPESATAQQPSLVIGVPNPPVAPPPPVNNIQPTSGTEGQNRNALLAQIRSFKKSDSDDESNTEKNEHSNVVTTSQVSQNEAPKLTPEKKTQGMGVFDDPKARKMLEQRKEAMLGVPPTPGWSPAPTPIKPSIGQSKKQQDEAEEKTTPYKASLVPGASGGGANQ